MSLEAPAFSFNKYTVPGALLIGGIASAVLWGIACSQAVKYYQSFPKDPRILHVIVPVLLVIDTFSFFLVCHVLYWYLIDNFLNPLVFLKPVWSLVIHVAVTSVTTFIVRCLFLRRVWYLSSGNRTLCGLIIITSMLDLICGIAITIRALELSTFAELSRLAVCRAVEACTYVDSIYRRGSTSLLRLRYRRIL